MEVATRIGAIANPPLVDDSEKSYQKQLDARP